MKILALNWQDLTNPQAGGAEVHLEEFLRRFVKKGHEVTLFCSGYYGAPEEEIIEGFKVIRRGKRVNFNWIAPKYLRKMVREEHFDVLLENINKVPFYTPWYLKIPTMLLIPHLFSTTVFSETNLLIGSYVLMMEKALKLAYGGKHINVPSESTRDDLILRGFPPEDISIIPCGVDFDMYTFDPEVRKFEKPSVLYLGRIKKYKSIDHLIRAFDLVLKKIPEAELNIVGKGDYLDPLKELAGKLKIKDRINFRGFVSGTKKVDFLRRSHVAVYPSPKEGWGLTNIEANACGTTVIAANVPGLRNSVNHDKSGYLYEYGNIEELAEKIYRLLTDLEERARLEKGALNWASQFSWDKAADQFLLELEAVASGAV